MAYAALVSLAQTIDLILNYQHSISPQVKNKIISIDKYVIFLQVFLEDLPDKANSLEGRITEVTHVAEDIIELLILSEQIHVSHDALLKSTVGTSKSKLKQQERRRWVYMQPRYVLLKLNVGSSRSKVKPQPRRKNEQPICYHIRELNKVIKKIEFIVQKVMEIKDSIIVKDVRLGDSTPASSSSRVAPIQKDAMVGFDNDLMTIKSRLCGESSKLEVLPIVGMGGIGKTTLARNTYDDPLIVECFDIRVWVTISQDYSVREIASGLLDSMKVLDANNDLMKVHKVYQNLKGRRYLIVLDDIWSIKAWNDLKMIFPDDGNGSRIMLTTRLSDVASYANSSGPVHEMHLMDEDQSWDLLRQKVFKQDPCPVELEYVGKKIARSCGGLPLAIAVISGLLTVDQTKAAWESVANDVTSAISANDEQFDKILFMSYTHLPHHLRPCFLYMGGFPKDNDMCVSRLIRLWVAEGFLKPNGCNKSFEETGEEYLEDLVKRSLVLVTKRKSNGRIKSFSIHDLMREICIRKAQEENFFSLVCPNFQKGTKIPRRVSIFDSDLNHLGNVYGSTIRTIIGAKYTRISSLQYFRLLKILDLIIVYESFFVHDNSIRFLPVEIYELFHLRYLSLDYRFRITAAISNLQNLQTLIIGPRKYHAHEAPCFVQLPVEIWRMRQLRHLILFCHLLRFQRKAMSTLENLQTLSVAINFICSKKILKLIPNLNKLGITYRTWIDDDEGIFEEEKYGEGKYDEDYQLHNLTHLQQLENLKLKIYDDFPFPEKVNPAFPKVLKKLTLSHWGRPWKDLKIVGLLPNLEVLKLRDYACIGDTWETTEGEFPQLNFLLIDISDLKHWVTESSHFPRLKCLVLRRCWYLSEIPDVIGDIPTLELIEVGNFNNKSLANSAKQIQDDQQSYGNNALQVHCGHY